MHTFTHVQSDKKRTHTLPPTGWFKKHNHMVAVKVQHQWALLLTDQHTQSHKVCTRQNQTGVKWVKGNVLALVMGAGQDKLSSWWGKRRRWRHVKSVISFLSTRHLGSTSSSATNCTHTSAIFFVCTKHIIHRFSHLKQNAVSSSSLSPEQD